jgi:hypothetical protein
MSNDAVLLSPMFWFRSSPAEDAFVQDWRRRHGRSFNCLRRLRLLRDEVIPFVFPFFSIQDAMMLSKSSLRMRDTIRDTVPEWYKKPFPDIRYYHLQAPFWYLPEHKLLWSERELWDNIPDLVDHHTLVPRAWLNGVPCSHWRAYVHASSYVIAAAAPSWLHHDAVMNRARTMNLLAEHQAIRVRERDKREDDERVSFLQFEIEDMMEEYRRTGKWFVE